MRITAETVIKTYPSSHTDKIGEYLLVYNPLSAKGVVVLNRPAAFLYDSITKEKKFSEIFSSAKRKDKRAKKSEIKKIIKDFLKKEIVFVDKPIGKNAIDNNPTKKISVWLHITNQCNLRCKYCFVYKTNEKMDLGLAVKSMQKIFKDAAKNKFKLIELVFGGGESLLVFDKIIFLINYGRELSKKTRIKIKYSLLTNGTLIDERVAKILKKETDFGGLDIYVSLDGTKKYHDIQRIFANGKGSFDLVEKGIDALGKYKVPFYVTITVTSLNIKNIPQITGFLLKKDIPFAFNLYQENIRAPDGLTADNKDLIKYMSKSFRIIRDDPPANSIINSLIAGISFFPHSVTCGLGISYFTVDHKGFLSSCPLMMENRIGSIGDKDIIKTIKEKRLIAQNGFEVDDKEICKTCSFRYICTGGCAYLTIQNKGKASSNSPYCDFYKAIIPEILKIEANRLIKFGLRHEKFSESFRIFRKIKGKKIRE
ncbi:radical SAM protein [Candidatus Roizmanbacteria bacterium]|jgi:uncharacterized protein|nr:radical SAM protein [Candidatus Roizmanbacteria bacterium]